MPSDHEPDIPSGLESFIRRLDDLSVVFGPASAPMLSGVRDAIVQAMAARDRGDAAQAFATLATAMDSLTRFADGLDPQEAAAMRAVAQVFGSALVRGDQTEAKRSAAVMFEKSGARQRKPQ